MIKQLILFAQLLGLFFYQILFTGDLTVTQKIPASIVQGEEALIEITINKSDLPGFAKVQQVFPDGFTAEPVETKGATFSFKDNKVKFIWMSLPVEEVFTISYKIVANETVEGDFTVGGKFSFISESERKNIEIPISSFKVVKKAVVEEPVIAEVVAEVVAPITEEIVEEIEEVIPEEVVIEEPLAEIVEEVVAEEIVKEEPAVSDVVAEKPAVVEEEVPITEIVEEVVVEEVPVLKIITIICKRTIETLDNGKYKVTVEINKKGVEGFAKISERIPDGFIASENNSNKGVFSFKNNTMKILWMGVPSEDIYIVSYNLEAKSATENGKYDIIGFYSYLENEATSKYVIDGSGFELNVAEVIAEEPVIVTPPKEEIVKPVIEEPVVAEVIEEIPVVVAEVKEIAVAEKEEMVVAKPIASKKSVTNTPAPENGVTYKVQVGAGHEKVPSTYFATIFSLKDNVSTINHEGWIKYLVGSFNEYKSARNKRNIVRGNVKTAFVTAYNSGTRITVQEALMISNQKWFK